MSSQSGRDNYGCHVSGREREIRRAAKQTWVHGYRSDLDKDDAVMPQIRKLELDEETLKDEDETGSYIN